MYSTVGDLHRWDEALYYDRLLGVGPLAQVTRNAASTGSIGVQYANDWYAVNRRLNFVGHATTFEIAEAEVDEGHWSSRTR